MERPYKNTRIDWHYWLNLAYVEDWQACALSLEIDPDSCNPARPEYWSGPGRHYRGQPVNTQYRTALREYERRLQLLKSNALDRKFFTLSTSADYHREVRLQEFVNWILHIGRLPPLPVELLSLADDPVTAFATLRSARVDYSTDHIDDSATYWRTRLPAEAKALGLDKYQWQWPLRLEARQLLKTTPRAKLDTLAADLVPIAKKLGFRNRSSGQLDANTIKRHVLTGVHKDKIDKALGGNVAPPQTRKD